MSLIVFVCFRGRLDGAVNDAPILQSSSLLRHTGCFSFIKHTAVLRLGYCKYLSLSVTAYPQPPSTLRGNGCMQKTYICFRIGLYKFGFQIQCLIHFFFIFFFFFFFFFSWCPDIKKLSPLINCILAQLSGARHNTKCFAFGLEMHRKRPKGIIERGKCIMDTTTPQTSVGWNNTLRYLTYDMNLNLTLDAT